MNRGRRLFLLATCAAMNLAWLFAGANYIALLTLHRPFPFLETVGTFILAGVLTHATRGKRWRVFQVLGLNACGFVAAGMRMIYVLDYPESGPFLNKGWIIEFFTSPRPDVQWLTLILLVGFLILVWIKGINLARKPLTYQNVCARFDGGLALFFLLFLGKLLAFAKAGIQVHDEASVPLALSFFVLGLLSIGLGRYQSDERRVFLAGYRGIGTIFGFILVVVLFGTGLALFFWPYMTMAAEIGYGTLRSVSGPVGWVLVQVVRFMYLGGGVRKGEAQSPDNPSPIDLHTPRADSWWSVLLEKILAWGLSGLLGLVLLGVVTFLVFQLLRWLLAKTPGQDKTAGPCHSDARWMDRLKTLLLRFLKAALGSGKGRGTAAHLFGALLGWGRRSGLIRQPSETPLEYGLRLQSRFPRLGMEIESIVEAFNQEVYGGIGFGEGRLASARSAWESLRSPRYWPARLKGRLL